MTDYTKLVKALRCKRDDCEGCDLAFLDNDEGWMCQYAAKDDDAAAAIEELQTHLEESTKSADAYRTMYFTKHGDITIEKVRELDEKDYYFHSALIRLMYRRIVEFEAQLPKRGEWIRVQKVDIPGEMHPAAFKCMCSVCRKEYLFPRIPQYCPDCGSMNTAKMEVQDADT